MAVINTIDDRLVHPKAASEVTGAPIYEVVSVIAIAANDDDTSKFFIAEVPAEAVIDEITLESPAITAGTAYDVGLYDTDGVVVSGKVDCFAANLDMSNVAGLPVGPLGDPIRQAMTALALTDANKKVYEIAGHVNKALPASGETQKKTKYRIGLTADTIGTGAGTIVARVKYRKMTA